MLADGSCSFPVTSRPFCPTVLSLSWHWACCLSVSLGRLNRTEPIVSVVSNTCAIPTTSGRQCQIKSWKYISAVQMAGATIHIEFSYIQLTEEKLWAYESTKQCGHSMSCGHTLNGYYRVSWHCRPFSKWLHVMHIFIVAFCWLNECLVYKMTLCLNQWPFPKRPFPQTQEVYCGPRED